MYSPNHLMGKIRISRLQIDGNAFAVCYWLRLMSVARVKERKHADLDFLRLTNPSQISREHHQYLEMSQAYLVRGSTCFFKSIWASEATYITNSRMKKLWKLFTSPNAVTEEMSSCHQDYETSQQVFTEWINGTYV